jgi:hypothetical protein
MDDEVLARAAALVGVLLARVHERGLDALAVDRDRGLVGVLLDDREQVGQKPPLGRRQLGPAARVLGVARPARADLANRLARGRDLRVRSPSRGVPVVGAQVLRGCALLRNR